MIVRSALLRPRNGSNEINMRSVSSDLGSECILPITRDLVFIETGSFRDSQDSLLKRNSRFRNIRQFEVILAFT